MAKNIHIENLKIAGMVTGVMCSIVGFVGGVLYIIKNSMEIHSLRTATHNEDNTEPGILGEVVHEDSTVD